jgi:hypothetical protein
MGSQALATDGSMDSSFARLGAARGLRRSGRFIASVCASMLIVAAGVSFAESEPARQELSSPTPSLWVRQLLRSLRRPRQLDRVAGMIKKAVYRTSGGLGGSAARTTRSKIPAIKTVACDLPLDVLLSMGIRIDP